MISNNINFLGNFGNVPKAFLTDQFINHFSKFYRPLGTFSYMIDIQLSGGNFPWIYHFSNILLFSLISSLLFLMLRRFNISPRHALSGTLIFCVHPLFVSAVTSVANRLELLLVFFSLLAFIFLIEYLGNEKVIFLILHWAAFTLALFCKETAAFLPFLFIIYFFTFRKNKGFEKKYLFNIILYAASGLFWYLIRSRAIKNFSVTGDEFGLTAFISNLRIIPESLSKFVIPFNIPPFPTFSILTTLTGVLIIVIIIIIGMRNKESQMKQKLFCISWFVVLMVPSMLYKLPNIDYLDHRFFLPFIGILLYFLLMLQGKWFTNLKINITWLIAAVIVILFSLSYTHTLSFSNPETFYNSAILQNSFSPLPYNNRGLIYYNQKVYDKAIEDFNEAIELNSGFAEAYTNRGLVYYDLKQYDRALADNNKAIEMKPGFAEAYYNRGRTYYSLRQFDKAMGDYDRSIALNPELSDVYNDRGNLYGEMEQYDKAIADYSKAIELSPAGAVTYNNRGWLYYRKNEIKKAEADFKTAISLNNNFVNAYKNLGSIYFNMKNFNAAIDYYSKVILLSGTDAQSYYYRGLSYLNINKTGLACKDFLKAREYGGIKAEDYLVKYCK